MTDIAHTSPIERVARVIVAAEISPNAEGDPWGGSVSDDVDAGWRDEIPRAAAILRTLREPTPDMLEAGRAAGPDVAEIWNAMVRAALAELPA